jgi:hypothetical protein
VVPYDDGMAQLVRVAFIVIAAVLGITIPETGWLDQRAAQAVSLTCFGIAIALAVYTAVRAGWLPQVSAPPAWSARSGVKAPAEAQAIVDDPRVGLSINSEALKSGQVAVDVHNQGPAGNFVGQITDITGATIDRSTELADLPWYMVFGRSETAEHLIDAGKVDWLRVVAFDPVAAALLINRQGGKPFIFTPQGQVKNPGPGEGAHFMYGNLKARTIQELSDSPLDVHIRLTRTTPVISSIEFVVTVRFQRPAILVEP